MTVTNDQIALKTETWMVIVDGAALVDSDQSEKDLVHLVEATFQDEQRGDNEAASFGIFRVSMDHQIYKENITSVLCMDKWKRITLQTKTAI